MDGGESLVRIPAWRVCCVLPSSKWKHGAIARLCR